MENRFSSRDNGEGNWERNFSFKEVFKKSEMSKKVCCFVNESKKIFELDVTKEELTRGGKLGMGNKEKIN